MKTSTEYGVLVTGVVGTVRRPAIDPRRMRANPMSIEMSVHGRSVAQLTIVAYDEQSSERTVLELEVTDFLRLASAVPDLVRDYHLARGDYVCASCATIATDAEAVEDGCSCGGKFHVKGHREQ